MKYTVVFSSHRRRHQRFGTRTTGMLVRGRDREEALTNIQDAIREYLAVVAEINRGQEPHEIEVAV